MIMNYAEIKKMDIANWPWLRTSLFVSWCKHRCPFCFNAEAWNFGYWKEFTDETMNELINEINKDYCEWLTILWWEPLVYENQEQVAKIIQEVRKRTTKPIWLYSWFTYEVITWYMYNNEKFKYIRDIINNIDVLIDWRFINELKDLALQFRWSRNQRILDVQKSLLKWKATWLEWVKDKKKYVKRSF